MRPTICLALALLVFSSVPASAQGSITLEGVVTGLRTAGVDRVLVVDCEPRHQVSRLMRRDGIDEALARRMLAAQADRAERLSLAHDALRNDGDPADLSPRVARLDRFYLGLARDAGAGQRPAGGLL